MSTRYGRMPTGPWPPPDGPVSLYEAIPTRLWDRVVLITSTAMRSLLSGLGRVGS
jgi:hypothetical protein